MGESRSEVVYIVVGLLGLASAVSGFLAEARRTQVPYDYRCYYLTSTSGFSLGIMAAVALYLAQTILSIASPCICCMHRNPNPKHSPQLCLFFSRITFGFAVSLFLSGAVLDKWKGFVNGNGVLINEDGTIRCYAVNRGIFGGGAALSISSLVLGIVYDRLTFSPATKEINHPLDAILTGNTRL